MSTPQEMQFYAIVTEQEEAAVIARFTGGVWVLSAPGAREIAGHLVANAAAAEALAARVRPVKRKRRTTPDAP